MKKNLLIAILCSVALFTSCSEQNKQNNNEQESHDKHENHQHQEHHQSHTANDHMHQKPIEELIANFESPERDAYQQPEKVMEYLGDLSGSKIMDIGAGSGYFSVKLAEKGAQVIAADVNDEFQKALKNRIEENDLKNIELRKIPYDNPNLADEEVDKVLIVNTYHHIEDRAQYFSKVRKGIKENGELVIIDFVKSDVPVGPPTGHKISIDQVVSELKKAGYSQFDINVDLLPYQYIIKAK